MNHSNKIFTVLIGSLLNAYWSFVRKYFLHWQKYNIKKNNNRYYSNTYWNTFTYVFVLKIYFYFTYRIYWILFLKMFTSDNIKFQWNYIFYRIVSISKRIDVSRIFSAYLNGFQLELSVCLVIIDVHACAKSAYKTVKYNLNIRTCFWSLYTYVLKVHLPVY